MECLGSNLPDWGFQNILSETPNGLCLSTIRCGHVHHAGVTMFFGSIMSEFLPSVLVKNVYYCTNMRYYAEQAESHNEKTDGITK